MKLKIALLECILRIDLIKIDVESCDLHYTL